MCLYTTSKKVQVAKEDIVCYKVMMGYYGDKGAWVSLYQRMAYKEGHNYELERQLQLLDVSKPLREYRYPYMVEEGFHSFANLSDALLFLNVYKARCPWLDDSRYTYVVVKCIIPEGTAYVEGSYVDWGNKFPSFCSEKIICEGEIKNE